MGASAMDVLMQHDWPGNIRELMHTIESLVVIGTNDVITPAELPSSLTAPGGESVLGMISDMDSPDLNLKDATAAAEAMGVDISTLSKKRKKYGI